MKFISIPTLIFTVQLPTEEQLQQATRPLAVCSTCKYALCSCGGCHSQECEQPCDYDEREVTR